MIVSDKNVQDALTYLADDPHPLAVARKAVTDAENNRKRVWAQCFLDADGTVDARKAQAECDQDHVMAQDGESEAILEFERHKSRCKAAEMIIEIWRSENANARAAERVR